MNNVFQFTWTNGIGERLLYISQLIKMKQPHSFIAFFQTHLSIEELQYLQKQKMTWFMNFCAPFLPNDPTINFHRYLQAALLALYTVAYALLHFYYKFWGPDNQPVEEESVKPAQNEKESESQSIDSSEQQSEKSKALSIKVGEHANDSCIQLKKTGTTWENGTIRRSTMGNTSEDVTLEQIEGYFPIVFGHFAIAMGLSIMYTPYAEQSIACLLYMLLTIPLLHVNAKRYQKWTLFVWILMAGLLLFIFTCGLLQIGQSNWDFINLTCFSTEYISLYD